MTFVDYKRQLLLCIFCIAAVFAWADDGGYHIKEWNYEAQVSKKNEWQIKETLLVNFHEPRHGIYRSLPQYYTYFHNVSPEGEKAKWTEFRYKLDIDHIHVNGARFDTEEGEDNLSSIVIRVGDAYKYVEGDVVYEFTYKLTYPDDRFDRYDLLFHSVLGADCNVNIEKFTFIVQFDKEIPEECREKLNINSGRWGEVGNIQQVQATVTDHAIYGTVHDVHPNHAITLQMYLPQGFYEDTFKVNPIYCEIFALLSIFFAILFIYRMNSNKQDKPVRVVEFYPPEGISSAEVGTIIDERVDLLDITSMVPWFAHKGYLKIREVPAKKRIFSTDADLELTKIKDLPVDAPQYQKYIMDIFFKDKDQLILSKMGNKYSEIEKAKLSLKGYFSGKRKLTESVGGFHWLLLNWLCVLSAILFSSAIEYADFVNAILALVGFGVPVLIVTAIRFSRNSDIFPSEIVNRLLDIFCIAASIFSMYGYGTLVNGPDIILPLGLAYIMFIFAFVAAFRINRIERNTRYRQELAGRLIGFRDFIDTAEKERLKMLVNENPEYFYEVLPYAMVFGLSDKWVKQFENIDLSQPAWYDTNNTRVLHGFTMNNMHHQINSNLQKAIEVNSHDMSSGSSYSSSGHSGGFSGGFSGGGGGGGGVGSW